MLIKQLFCGFIGLCSGLVVSGGIFAFIVSIGLVPRLAGKTHTGKHMKIYETFIAYGGILGNIYFIYNFDIMFGQIFAGIFGLFSGIFVGCLALALAETVNTTAIFSRRINMKYGIAFLVISIAIGKLIGSMLYFYKEWY